MRLHTLTPRPGARHRRKRLGCGESSGHGKTSGRGHKGQKARAGAAIRIGFEGGQMPLYRRIPRKGFNNTAFQEKCAIINVGSLEKRFEAGAEVNAATLREARLLKGRFDSIKILAVGELTKALKVSVDAISAAAREKIEKAGGSVTLPAAG
ncbi:MAG: 50S ribosomal protein L15 [Verrucomicrobiales bacterium]